MWRWQTGALIFLTILAVSLFWVVSQPNEPRYEGRRVSAWVRELQGKGPAARARAEKALRQIGTNAIPVLRRELRSEDSTVKLALLRLFWRQDRVRIQAMPARGWHVRAALACGLLGPQAQPLIPDLLDMAKGDFVHFEVAVSALGQMGEGAVPQLVAALADENARVRQAAARALGALGPKAKPALTALIDRLHDVDLQVRVNSSIALGAIGVGSGEVVRALANALSDQNSQVRDSVIEALGQLGPQARDAVPALLKMLSDPDELVRTDATNVLESIPPPQGVAPPQAVGRPR
jgi:HEAT repeat protein